MNNLVVRWIDKDGKTHQKFYNDQRTAYKARQWLLDNGGLQVDVAIVRTQNKTSPLDTET